LFKGEWGDMNKKRLIQLVAFGLLTILAGGLLTSCGAVSYLDSGVVSTEYEEPRAYYDGEDYAMDYSGEPAPETKVINGGGVGETTLRHVIRNGSMDLTVQNTRDTMREVRDMVIDAGGIVSNSYIYEIREGLYGAHMTLRIPERLFDSFMEQLETYGRATNMQTGIDDVTMQYVDLESRLKNQEAQEERLVEILEMAETVEDVLEVERELYRIRGEIESMTAQLTYLRDQVTYATINLSLREEHIPTETISPGAFDNLGRKISQAFIGSINLMLNAVSYFIIAISALLPVVIILGILIFLIILLIRKTAGRKQPKPADDGTEANKEA
jgi:hypothetical protein